MAWTRVGVAARSGLPAPAPTERGRVLRAMVLAWAAVVTGLPAAASEADLELIPRPVSVEWCAGAFTLDARTAIRYSNGSAGGRGRGDPPQARSAESFQVDRCVSSERGRFQEGA